MIKDTTNYKQVPILPISAYGTIEGFASFYVHDGNRKVFDFFRETISQNLTTQGKFVYLYGAAFSGKSHLLDILLYEANKLSLKAISIDLDEYIDLNPNSFLDEVVNYDVICLDNIDHVVGRAEWENELFNFYNNWISKGSGLLVVTSERKYQDINVKKPDLLTRLSAAISLKIEPVPKDQQIDLLLLREKCRGSDIERLEIEKLVKPFETLEEYIIAIDKYEEMYSTNQLARSKHGKIKQNQSSIMDIIINWVKNRLKKNQE